MDVGNGVLVVVDFDVLFELTILVPVFDLDEVLYAETLFRISTFKNIKK